MKRAIKAILAGLGLFVLWAMLVTEPEAQTLFETGTVTAVADTAVVPITVTTDSLFDIILHTIEYDGNVAHFERVELGAAVPDWEILVVNDNMHIADCAGTPPLKRLTVLFSEPIVAEQWRATYNAAQAGVPPICVPRAASIPCVGMMGGESLRVVFSRVAYGETALTMIDHCQGQAANPFPNQAGTCSGYVVLVDWGTLLTEDGRLRFEGVTDVADPIILVDDRPWGRVKVLYR